MGTPVFLLLAIWAALLSGCSTSNLYGGIYEGVRVRNQLQSTPSERLNQAEPMNYQQYERERKERFDSEKIDGVPLK